jgi:hypothetical protein
MAGSIGMTLRSDPDRGVMVAAAGVLIATAIVMIDIRMSGQWGDGAQLLVSLAAFVPVFGSALLAPPEQDRPHPYQSVLIVAGLALLVLVLVHFAEVLGSDSPLNASGAIMWMSAVFAAVAAYPALRLGSAIATLAAAVADGIAVLAFVDEVFDPSGVTTFRWILLLLIVGYAVGAAALSDTRPRHSVQLVNAAALATIALALTFLGSIIAGAFTGFGSESIKGPGFGWELVLFAASFAVIAYATISSERGPAYLGFIALLSTAIVVGLPKKIGEGSLVGWPFVLLLAGAAVLVFALRSNGATAAPPPPPPPATSDT